MRRRSTAILVKKCFRGVQTFVEAARFRVAIAVVADELSPPVLVSAAERKADDYQKAHIQRFETHFVKDSCLFRIFFSIFCSQLLSCFIDLRLTLATSSRFLHKFPKLSSLISFFVILIEPLILQARRKLATDRFLSDFELDAATIPQRLIARFSHFFSAACSLTFSLLLSCAIIFSAFLPCHSFAVYAEKRLSKQSNRRERQWLKPRPRKQRER